MELISRTMHDMHNVEGELPSDALNADQSGATNMNKYAHYDNCRLKVRPLISCSVYWPYKFWQRQEKDRQKQQLETFMKQSKLTSQQSVYADNSDTCERSTSPIRMMTPGRRLITPATNPTHAPVEITVVDRPSTRNSYDRATPTVVIRDNPAGMTGTVHDLPSFSHRPLFSSCVDRPTFADRRPASRMNTGRSPSAQDRPSRRGYRVATSMGNSFVENPYPPSPTMRGKTPLI